MDKAQQAMQEYHENLRLRLVTEMGSRDGEVMYYALKSIALIEEQVKLLRSMPHMVAKFPLMANEKLHESVFMLMANALRDEFAPSGLVEGQRVMDLWKKEWDAYHADIRKIVIEAMREGPQIVGTNGETLQ